MGSFYYLTGWGFNHLERLAAANITCGGAGYTASLAALYDRMPSSPAVGNPVPYTDLTFTADLNIALNGGMETVSSGVLLSDWTIGAGTVERSNTQAKAGTYSMKIGAGSGWAYQYVTVLAGERVNFRASVYGDGANSAKVSVLNMHTGNWLQTDGTWGASADVLSASAAAWTDRSLDGIIVETSNLVDTMPLRIRCLNSAGTCYYDEVYLWPSTDWISVHAHNIPPVIVPEFRSSTDNFSGSDVLTATIAKYPHVVSAQPTMIDRRYVRLKLSGDYLYSAPWFGELVWGQRQTLAVGAAVNPGVTVTWSDAQVRQTTIARDLRVLRVGSQPTRRIEFSQHLMTTADWQDTRDKLVRRSALGAHPVVLMPASEDPETVLYARLDASWAHGWGPLITMRDDSRIVAQEMPAPAWIA